MLLAYLDDSHSDDDNRILVVGAVLIRGDEFLHLEHLAGVVVENLIPHNELAQFTEFHAHELFQGTGVFKERDQQKRHESLELLLTPVAIDQATYIYAAVDKDALARSATGSADALDVAFRVCLLGIEAEIQRWNSGTDGLRVNASDMCVVIMDAPDAKQKQEALRRSFLTLRSRWRPSQVKGFRTWHLHDAMFFADSRDSVGVQVVDACNYIMGRRLNGREDRFFEMLAGKAICAKPEPEWSTFGWCLRTHEDPLLALESRQRSQ